MASSVLPMYTAVAYAVGATVPSHETDALGRPHSQNGPKVVLLLDDGTITGVAEKENTRRTMYIYIETRAKSSAACYLYISCASLERWLV